MTLIEWLRGVLDEVERTARAVKDSSAPWDGQWVADGTNCLRTHNGHVLAYGKPDLPIKPGVVAHWALHDPAHVLAEVDAKRRLIDVILDYEDRLDGEYGCSHDAAQIAAGECPCNPPDQIPGFRLLALPYADWPGYRDEWRP